MHSSGKSTTPLTKIGEGGLIGGLFVLSVYILVVIFSVETLSEKSDWSFNRLQSWTSFEARASKRFADENIFFSSFGLLTWRVRFGICRTGENSFRCCDFCMVHTASGWLLLVYNDELEVLFLLIVNGGTVVFDLLTSLLLFLLLVIMLFLIVVLIRYKYYNECLNKYNNNRDSSIEGNGGLR